MIGHAGDRLALGLYSLTLLCGSFLLFLLQPIIAKELLPWFGGAANVWAVCLVFFQLGLLLGYAFADFLVHRLTPARQLALQLVLLTAAGLSLPITPGAHWQPASTVSPPLSVLGALTTTVGLPYVLMAATTPLVQSWYARRFPARIPYRLFALSNLASLLALLIYPSLIEPRVGTRWQAYAWSGGYLAWAVLILLCAWCARGARQPAPRARAAEEPARRGARTALARYLSWAMLAALGSFLLVAVTSRMTRDIAAIPLLWIVPLTVYLLTFIASFYSSRWLSAYALTALAAAAAVFYAVLVLYLQLPGGTGRSRPLGAQIGVLCVVLGCAGLFCHGRLATSRPPAAELTRFYLLISLGGVAGAMLVALAAPTLLSVDFDLELGMVALAVALLLHTLTQRRPFILLGIATCVLTAWSCGQVWRQVHTGTLLTRRNFYGVLRVLERTTGAGAVRFLSNGAILHGAQYAAPDLRRRPTEYYGNASGIAHAFAALQKDDAPHRIGVIGLGVGTLTAYGRARDVIRFYELNPAVIDIARREFSYLRDSAARIELVGGDARLSLQGEPSQAFDLIVVDAFSSDAIPVHLLTLEALDVYLRHLKPTGMLAFHTSNRYLDLPPVIGRIAEARGLVTRIVAAHTTDEFNTPSTWVLASRDPRYFGEPELASVEQALPHDSRPLWTDDFSNLLQFLR